MIRVEYLPEFWEDVRLASQWLDDEQPGLGGQFVAATLATLDKVVDQPQAQRVINGTIRRYVLRRFRYLLFYEVHEDSILFLGIVHGSRDVTRWLRDRHPPMS